MMKNTEVERLRKIYNEMDAEGRQKMTLAAMQLLNGQKTFENRHLSSVKSNRRFLRLTGCITTVLLLLITAYFFWISQINPSLQMAGITPPLMVRIIITAFC